MMTTVPDYESNQYAFHVLRVGAALVRKCDNASVYFQPGDCAAEAEEQAAHCFEAAEMFPGEHVRCFNRWAGEYF